MLDQLSIDRRSLDARPARCRRGAHVHDVAARPGRRCSRASGTSSASRSRSAFAGPHAAARAVPAGPRRAPLPHARRRPARLRRRGRRAASSVTDELFFGVERCARRHAPSPALRARHRARSRPRPRRRRQRLRRRTRAASRTRRRPSATTSTSRSPTLFSTDNLVNLGARRPARARRLARASRITRRPAARDPDRAARARPTSRARRATAARRCTAARPS